MHPKHFMLLLLATITLTTTCMVCISIIDSLFNTHTSLSLFHLWDCLDGQSRRLKLGAKLCSPLRIYFRNLSSQFLHVTNLINTHSPARKRPDRFSHTTSTLRKILSSQRGGCRKACLGDCISQTNSQTMTHAAPKIHPFPQHQIKHTHHSTRWNFGALTEHNILNLPQLSGVTQLQCHSNTFNSTHIITTNLPRSTFPMDMEPQRPGSSLATRYDPFTSNFWRMLTTTPILTLFTTFYLFLQFRPGGLGRRAQTRVPWTKRPTD